MERLAAAIYLAVAAMAGAVGAFWAYLKVEGEEVDLCNGSNCKSGWFGVAASLAFAVIAAWAGLSLLRRERNGSRS